MAEIFQDYEINRNPWWEKVWRVVAGSVVVHIVLVACMLYVPAVRDAFNIASMLAGVDYVDEAYNRTVIRDDVTMLDMRERFEYPPGYFQMGASPTFAPVAVEPVAPQLPPVVIQTPKPQPQPTPVATPATTPNPSASPGQGTVASAQPTPTPAESIDKQAEKIAAENKIDSINEDAINKRALKDALARWNERKQKGEIDLSQNVEVTIEAELKQGGKLENAQVVQKSGDPRLIEAAKDLVAAVSDSNLLFFLHDPKNPEVVKRLRITIKLDQTDLTATVSSELSTELKAQVMALMYRGALNKGKERKKGQDEEVLINSTQISTDGKQVIVNFKMPRPTAEAMLKKQLPAT